MERYILSKEFFGGLIRDTLTKSNMSIDELIYDLFTTIITKENDIDSFINKHEKEFSISDLLEIIRDLIDMEILKINIKNNKSAIQGKNFLSAPLRVFYDITYKCNLHCKHCFTKSGQAHNDELSLQQKKELIKRLVNLGVGRISIAGGEPFECDDLFPFLQECKDNKLTVSITTNGTRLDEIIVKKLNDFKIKNLTVSFDGGNQKSMDLIRGLGTYELALAGLKNLNKYYSGKYSIKTTLMKNNIKEIDQLVDIAVNNGCSSIKFNCVRLDGRAVNNKDIVALDQESYIETIKAIESVKEKYLSKIIIKAPLNIYCDDDYDYIPELGFGCFAGKESICISPTGDVKPCSHFPSEFICGNVKTQNLEDIWRNSDILKQFRELKGNDTCNNCNKYSYCRSGCRFRAFSAGDINGIDPFCYLELNKLFS